MMGGRGMMGSDAYTGGSYDPEQIVAHLEAMIPRHEAYLATLEGQLAEAEDEQRIALLTRRVEMQQLQIAYLKGKLPVAQALPAEWPDGAIALAEYDVAFFSSATAVDPWVESWIAHRLERAEQRLAYLQEQQQ
ncbi:MAG: hypothetical protein ACOY93_03215, partial [Bacillota bacterium]